MKKIFSIIIFCLCFNLSAQTSNSNYFTIGSTQNKVLQVQGEPSSVTNTGTYTIFSFGSSTVSFKNGIVDGYNNAGNLKVKMISSDKVVSTIKKTNKPTLNKTKQVNNQEKWIYFIYLPTDNSNDINGNSSLSYLFKREYSKLYSISNYTAEKQKNLEFCLTNSYKKSTGNGLLLLAKVFDDRDLALMSWNIEKGTMIKYSPCDYRRGYDGVVEY